MMILALVRNYIPSYQWVIDAGWNIADCVSRSYDLEGMQTREAQRWWRRRKSGLNGVEKRVGRRHALLSPLRQAITAGRALAIWDVNRLGWPALHGFDLDRLALHRPVL